MHWIIWLVLFVAFAFVELNTVQMVSIWFALGCIGAGVVSVITESQNFTYELIAFAVTTALALIITRPFVKKVTHTEPTPTNADALPGQTAIVTEEINNVKATGAVTVKGAVWTARTETDTADTIPINSVVEIIKIDGVKLIVKAK